MAWIDQVISTDLAHKLLELRMGLELRQQAVAIQNRDRLLGD
jgi:hypothetical protein